MALIIKPTENKTIEVPGLDITLEQLYVRIEFAGRADGKTIEIATASYMDKEKYEAGKPCMTTVPMGGIKGELLPGEIQSLETAHTYAKAYYENLGYEVEIKM